MVSQVPPGSGGCDLELVGFLITSSSESFIDLKHVSLNAL